jgi:toxin ParE1/3/4
MNFIWSKTAREEYRDAIRWYEDASPRLGERFSRLVGDVLAQIAENPSRFAYSKYGARHARIKRFPYCVHYIERQGNIIIVAVFHEKRDPEQLKARQ